MSTNTLNKNIKDNKSLSGGAEFVLQNNISNIKNYY